MSLPPQRGNKNLTAEDAEITEGFCFLRALRGDFENSRAQDLSEVSVYSVPQGGFALSPW